MRRNLTLFLVLTLCLSTTLAQDSAWFPELETIQADNASRLQPLAIFIDYRSATLSPDGRYLAMRYGGTGLALFDMHTGQNRNYQGWHQPIFSQDSSLMAIGDSDSRIIRIVHLEEGIIDEITVPYSQCGFLRPEEFHPNNQFLLMSASDGGDCWISSLIDLETGEIQSTYSRLVLSPMTRPGDDVEFSSNGATLVAQNFLAIRIYDSFNPDGTFVQVRSEIEAHCDIEPIRFIESFFAAYDDDCQLILIDPETDAIVRTFPTENPYLADPILAYGDGILYTASDMYDEGIRLYTFDFFTGETLATAQLIPPVDYRRRHLAMNPNHDIVMATYPQTVDGYDALQAYGQVLVWNASTAEIITNLPFGAYTPVEKLQFNPEGTLLLTSGLLHYAYNVTMLWGVIEDNYYVPRLYGDAPYTPFRGLENNYPEFNPLFNVDCPAAPPMQFTVGQAVFVPTAVEADSNRNLRLRDAPNGEQTGSLLPGSYAVIVDGPVCGDDGLRWWGLASIDDSSLRGWAVDGFAPDDYLLLPRED